MKTSRVKEFDASPQPIEFKRSPREVISSTAEKIGKFVNRSIGMEDRNPNRNKRTGIGVAIGALVATTSLSILSFSSDTECIAIPQDQFGDSLTDAANNASEVIMNLGGNPEPGEIVASFEENGVLTVCDDPDSLKQIQYDLKNPS